MLRIAPPLPQLRAHDPCGHWHKGNPADESGGSAFEPFEYAANCYEPAITTDGTDILLVLCGRHRKNEFYMVRYNIPTGKWNNLLFVKDVLCSNWDAGVSAHGGLYASHVFTYDITGDQYNEETSNPRMITHVAGQNGIYNKEWPLTEEINGRGKVAVRSSGTIVCLTRISTTWSVQSSNDYGTGFSTIYTLPGNVTDGAIAIDYSDGVVYVAVVDDFTNQMRVYSGASTPTGWALKSTTTVVSNPKTLRFLVDGSRFFATVGGTTTRFYYSTNKCTSFTARDLHEYSVHFAATDKLLYNLADGPDWRTLDYEQTSITWNSVVVDTPTDRCSIYNVGQLVVYAHSTLRDDSPQDEVLTILMSRNLGLTWSKILTPIRYFATVGDANNYGDNPVWPFVPQYAKL